MYKIFERSFDSCSVEFSLMTTKKKKMQFLKAVLSPFLNEHTVMVGEINGLDFHVEKIHNELETDKLTISSHEDGYMTLKFSSTSTADFSIVLSNFDRFSEGYYIICFFSECKDDLNEFPDLLTDQELDGCLLKLSVQSDSTLLDFEFKDESIYNKFISTVR